MAMDPAKKKMLMIGIPVVVGIALILILKNKSTAAATTGTVATTGTSTNNGAVDVGQLSAFESTVSDQLATLESTSSTPTPTPAVPSSPAPGPIYVAPNIPAPTPVAAPVPAAAPAFNRYGVGLSGASLGLGSGLWDWITNPAASRADSASGQDVQTSGNAQYVREGSTPVPASPSLPGYGAGVSELEAANGGSVHSNPGIAGQTVSYNGVPL